MRKSIAPTLNDVAREVGCSAMTVSVVLNGAISGTRVSPATRTRIIEAAARLQYHSNAVARCLSRRRMSTLGVVGRLHRSDPTFYILELLYGILDRATDLGQNVTIFSAASQQDDFQEQIAGWCDGRVDGLIFLGANLDAAHKTAIWNHHTQFVTMHNDSAAAIPDVTNLDADNEGGAYKMVRHLIEQGHRRIAYLSGNTDYHGAAQRLAGCHRALQEQHIVPEADWVVRGEYSASSGYLTTRHLLHHHQRDALPTAIFCGNDAMAAGCLEALAEAGLRVPHDLSVAGFDDTLTASLMNPPLTTVRQPLRQMGRIAVQRLLELLGDGDMSQNAEVQGHSTEIFDVELVLRASTSPPAQR